MLFVKFGQVGFRLFQLIHLLPQLLSSMLKLSSHRFILVLFCGNNFDEFQLLFPHPRNLFFIVLLHFPDGVFEFLRPSGMVLILSIDLFFVSSFGGFLILPHFQDIFGELIDADAFLKQLLCQFADLLLHECVIFFAVAQNSMGP